VALAVMNFSFYQAFARIPLGIAVTIEFLGPLTVAVASSRRLIDLAWVVLAGLGVALLARGGTHLASGAVPGSRGGSGLAVTGVAFALVAAAAWAAYILLSASTGRRLSGSTGLVIAMIIAALPGTPRCCGPLCSAPERSSACCPRSSRTGSSSRHCGESRRGCSASG